MERHRSRGLTRLLMGLGILMAGGIGYSRLTVPHHLPLMPALPGSLLRTRRRAGPLAYYRKGEGRPLLLVHSINAAASAFEMRSIQERATETRMVFAVDLPGFGFSDRSNRAYGVRLYTDAIHDMLDVIADACGGEPIDAVAVSLSCEFVARAALERPQRFRSLTLVTPTGFQRGSDARRGKPGGTREVPFLHGVASVPIWKQALFDALTSRRSIRFFLEKTFGSKDIDEDLLDYDYITTHQPGAPNAPLAFVSGRLFSSDIRTVYEQLRLPVFLAHATRGDFQDFTEVGWARERANWSVHSFATGALVHLEDPSGFMRMLDQFLARKRPSIGHAG